MNKHNRLFLFEEHSSTLPIWWQQKHPIENDNASLSNTPAHSAGTINGAKTVVYLDAHLDLQQTDAGAVDRLRQCQNLAEVQALEAPSHLNPANRFSYGIENFLYAAHQLKLLDRLIWVAPPHIPRDYSRSLLEYMQQMDGISFAELSSFKKISAGALRGTLLGLDITICDYTALGELDVTQDYFLDVDIDFFVDVPADQLWIDPALVISSVVDQLGEPSVTTISRAVGSGFTPLAFRFVGDYVYSQLDNNRADFEYYKELYTSINNLAQDHIEKGQAQCHELIKLRPELGAAYYVLAISTKNAATKQALLLQAQNADPAYAFDLARESIGLLHRKKAFDTNSLKTLLAALNQLELSAVQRRHAEVALAQVLAAAGHRQAALKLLAKQRGDYAGHPDISLAIAAGQLKDTQARELCKNLLEQASNQAKNTTTAQLYLGDLAFEEEDYTSAIEHYTSAHQRASAWMIPLDRMKKCYAKLGNHTRESELESLIIERLEQFESLSTAS